MTVDGKRTVRLTTTAVFEGQPSVSFDGHRIAFRLGGFPGRGIWTMYADGSRRQRWTRGSDGSPAWAADGRSIYFVRSAPNSVSPSCGSIFRVDARGARRITNPFTNGHSHQDPAVSPDGRRIAFSDWDACEGGTSSPRLHVIDPFGRPTRDLRLLPRNGYYPDPEHCCATWSPDGAKIAFLKNGGLTVANRDGSGEREITRTDVLTYSSPAWSPDGRWIAFITAPQNLARKLVLVHPDGSGEHQIKGVNADDDSVAWLPTLPR